MFNWLKRLGGKWEIIGYAKVPLMLTRGHHIYLLYQHTKTGEFKAEVINPATGWSKSQGIVFCTSIINDCGEWFKKPKGLPHA